MRSPIAVIAVATSLVLSGCATSQGTGANYVPIIDMKDVDLEKARVDTTECQAYATQVMSAGESAAAGALAGALVGALLGAVTKTSRNEGAGVGLIAGGLGGAAEGERNQRSIISKCMAGRGYRVLN